MQILKQLFCAVGPVPGGGEQGVGTVGEMGPVQAVQGPGCVVERGEGGGVEGRRGLWWIARHVVGERGEVKVDGCGMGIGGE